MPSSTRAAAAIAWLLAMTAPAATWAQPSEPGKSPSQPSPPPEPEPAPEPEPEPAEPGVSARDVADDPRPDQAAGTSAPRFPGTSGPRRAGQVALFVPKVVTWVAFAPVRGALWTFNKFALGDRFQQIFFNDEGNLGLFPVAFFETGFGLNVGARFIYRDLFGTDGKLSARAGYGGQFRQIYAAKATTGQLFGDRFEAEVEGEFQIYPRSRFFGIGNEDDISEAGMAVIDPLADPTAIKTRYSHDDYRIELTAAVRVWSRLFLRASGAYKHREFNDDAELKSGEVLITDAYDTMGLVGFDTGLSNFYPELELVWDSRRITTQYVSGANPSTGWKLGVFGGYAKGRGDDPSDYLRYGVDLQRNLELYASDRYLVLRAYLEGVTGELDEVPFIDLPHLGGPVFLRGYDRDRFRDRIATLGTVEYNYPMAGNVSGFLFTDVGRVYRSFDDIDGDSLEDFHVGFGGGLQGHTRNTFITRVSFFTSIDGDFFFNLSFDPVFDTSSREQNQ